MGQIAAPCLQEMNSGTRSFGYLHCPNIYLTSSKNHFGEKQRMTKKLIHEVTIAILSDLLAHPLSQHRHE